MKGKSRVVLFVLLFVPLLLGGCWNRKELNQLAIVSAVGVDLGENHEIKLTAQIVKTTALKEGEVGKSKAFYVLSSSGDTVFEAVRNFVSQSGRKLNWSHNTVIVMGGKLAREGVTPVLDFFMRDHELRLLTWVMITDGKAEDIVQAESPIENIAAQQLDMMLKDYGVLSKSVAVNLLHFVNQIADESLQPVVGRIELEESGGKKMLALKGAGVFRRDRLIGWLDPLPTRGYLWIRDKVKSAIITVPCPGEEKQLVSLEVKKAKGKIKPYLDKGEMKYSVEVNVVSNVGEENCPADLANPDIITALEDEQRQAVEKEIKLTIDQAQQKFKLDFVGLGAETSRKLPKEWKGLKEGWEEIFPNSKVEVTVKSKINQIGLKSTLKVNK
ncbi:MAG TPA: Ger(x)C family spore germination protein [Candidatus Deferrimicrobium sp.]|nr:Ger(x)C family spore germination protein [Candidatus Deferrimicrobium sp.]